MNFVFILCFNLEIPMILILYQAQLLIFFNLNTLILQGYLTYLFKLQMNYIILSYLIKIHVCLIIFLRKIFISYFLKIKCLLVKNLFWIEFWISNGCFHSEIEFEQWRIYLTLIDFFWYCWLWCRCMNIEISKILFIELNLIFIFKNYRIFILNRNLI